MTKTISKRNKFIIYMQRYWALYVMLILPLAFFFVFRYWPMVNLLLAFKENNIIKSIWELRWVGLSNLEQAVNHPRFMPSVRNTIMFSLLDLAAGFPAPIILALLLNELKFKMFKRVTQTISYLPHFLSWIIVSGLAIRLFSSDVGTVNGMLSNYFNIGPIPFLNSEPQWVGTVVLLGVWKSIGWNTIIYLAAITAVNPELYEAADMDGASRLRKMWHITLPGIRSVIVILFILALGQMMSADFERFMALANPLVEKVSEVLPLFIYKWGLTGPRQFDMRAIMTAVGLLQNAINLGLLLGANMIVKKLDGEGLW